MTTSRLSDFRDFLRHAAGRHACGAMTALLFACSLVLTTVASAQEARPIQLIVGFPPGGSNDTAARIIAPHLSQQLGVPVLVVNKPGANAVLGADFVARAPADGNTLLVVSASPLVIIPHTGKVPYDTLKDFAGVITLGATPEVIAVNPALPIKDLRELMELARTRSVTVGSPGSGGMPHLVIELMKSTSPGSKLMHVPYKGAAPAMTDVLGGHVDAVAGDLASYFSQIRDGKLRALVVTAPQRVDLLPAAATAREQGYDSLVAENWFGVLAPAKTPRAVIDRLHGALAKVALLPQVKEQLAAAGVVAGTSASPEAFQAFLRDEHARWGKIARESGAKLD